MKHLERRYGTGQLHFITCSCFGASRCLGTARFLRGDCFLTILSEVRERYDFALLRCVVMYRARHPPRQSGDWRPQERLFEFATIIPATGQALDCP